MPDDDGGSPRIGALPLLDMGPLRRGEAGAAPAFARDLRAACEGLGFYLLRGHGVPEALTEATLAATRDFHALPEAEKLRSRVNAHNNGYLPIKGSILRTSQVNANTKPSLNAAYFVRRDRRPDDPDVLADRPLRGLNQWPAQPAGFRAAALAYLDAMRALGMQLLPAYAEALGLAPDWFDAAFAEPNMTLRMTHYPAVQAFAENEHSFDPHTDLGFITLLPSNPVGGLAVRRPDGDWLEVPHVPGALVVNSGDMLARWSNDRFRSTPHRVLNRGGADRYAIPFFFDPHPDTLIECLPGCCGPGNPARYPPILFDDYFQWFTRRNYLHRQEEAKA